MFRGPSSPPLVSKSVSLPAGTAGLNDLDPIAQMDPSFLIDSVNFYPDNGLLVVRPGYQEWATGIGNPVDTILNYDGTDGTFQRFAATRDGIFNISSPTTTPANVKPATNGYWEFVNFATAGAQFLIAANGADAAVYYDGANWGSFIEKPTPGAPGEISGVDPSKLSFVMAHKARLWFIEKNSMTAWFLPLDSLGGVAQPFYLGGIFKRGGYLVSMARWSADSGEGMDDRLVFFTSTGEIASYGGSDPEDATDWSLDSVFFLAAPLSARSVTDYGGDLLLLTRRGLIPISTLVSGGAGEVLFSSALTRRISRTLIRFTSIQSPPFPPEVTLNNDAAWVVINMFNPIPEQISAGGNRPVQLVMNSLTGAWGKFDYPVRTVRSIGRLFYMGTEDGRVVTITPDSYLDNVQFDGTEGLPILCSLTSAYTYLGDLNSNKHAKMIRPVFQTDVKPSFVTRVLADFRTDAFSATPVPAAAAGNARWDLAKWDQANWAGFENVYRPWLSANVLGYAFAWQLNLSAASATGISSVEWISESGGFI